MATEFGGPGCPTRAAARFNMERSVARINQEYPGEWVEGPEIRACVDGKWSWYGRREVAA